MRDGCHGGPASHAKKRHPKNHLNSPQSLMFQSAFALHTPPQSEKS